MNGEYRARMVVAIVAAIVLLIGAVTLVVSVCEVARAMAEPAAVAEAAEAEAPPADGGQPEWLPDMTLRPDAAALVPVILIVVQVLLELPGVSRFRSWGVLFAMAIGVVADVYLLTPRGAWTVDRVVEGIVAGLAASGVWKVGHEAVKSAATRGSRVAQDLVRLSRSDGTGGWGHVPLPVLLFLAVGGSMALAGCGAHEFMLEAPAVMAQGLAEVETGIDEYHAAAVAELDQAEERLRQALRNDLVLNLLQLAKTDPANAPPEDEIRQAVDDLLVRYHGPEYLGGIKRERENEAERYRRLKSLVEWLRRVAGQVAEIETDRYATVEDLRALAQRYVAEQFGRQAQEGE